MRVASTLDITIAKLMQRAGLWNHEVATVLLAVIKDYVALQLMHESRHFRSGSSRAIS